LGRKGLKIEVKKGQMKNCEEKQEFSQLNENFKQKLKKN
jgi:hypothetical protein